MADVDPDDDTIRRYVVRRYAHDPDRHERRHQVVAAFDNKREYRKLLKALNSDLQRRRARGHQVDPREHYTGAVLEAGYRREQQAGRLLRNAVRHQAALPDGVMEGRELPPNVTLLRRSPDASKDRELSVRFRRLFQRLKDQ